jgi:hypothetical protein
MKYTIYELDVWAGEEEETYEKNNFFEIASIDLPKNATDGQILAKLNKLGYFLNMSNVKLRIDNHDCEGFYYEIVDEQNKYPLLDLKRV